MQRNWKRCRKIFRSEGSKPEDAAGIASFLAAEDSDYVTGTTVFGDGGLLWNYQER
jgi:hypothetical protein